MNHKIKHDMIHAKDTKNSPLSASGKNFPIFTVHPYDPGLV